jgi:hypothetical protein
MNYELASQIHVSIEATEHELRVDLYRAAVRYSALRSEWHLANPDARHEMENRRTVAHNFLIDALNILTRNLLRDDHDVSWRKSIGDDRKAIGDFAVFLTARFGILAR